MFNHLVRLKISENKFCVLLCDGCSSTSRRHVDFWGGFENGYNYDVTASLTYFLTQNISLNIIIFYSGISL